MNRAGGTLIGGEDVAHGKFQQGFIREDAVAKIGVIGGGAFGTAMACVMRRSRHEIALWAREPEVAAAINKDSLNPLFLPGIRLAAGIVATNDLGRATAGADFLVLAPPAQHMRSVNTQLRPFLKEGTPLVSCSKGIERGTCAFMSQVIAETLPCESRRKVSTLSSTTAPLRFSRSSWALAIFAFKLFSKSFSQPESLPFTSTPAFRTACCRKLCNCWPAANDNSFNSFSLAVTFRTATSTSFISGASCSCTPARNCDAAFTWASSILASRRSTAIVVMPSTRALNPAFWAATRSAITARSFSTFRVQRSCAVRVTSSRT